MSLTLSIPPATVRDAKSYAQSKGTTVSELVRQYFASVTKPKDTNGGNIHVKRFFDIADRINVRSPKGTRYTKDDIYSL